MKYTVDYFIKKFEAIPESEWAVGVFKSFDEKRCALGHCFDLSTLLKIDKAGVQDGNSLYKPTPDELETSFKESHSLCKLFDSKSANKGSGRVIEINNGMNPLYPQPTPKQRILAALYDIKKLQPKDIEPATKTKTVYVAVPTTISEQAKELVLS